MRGKGEQNVLQGQGLFHPRHGRGLEVEVEQRCWSVNIKADAEAMTTNHHSNCKGLGKKEKNNSPTRYKAMW